MSRPRIGELFAGYGGLGMGLQAVVGGEVVWFSEFDKAPSKILAHHWPDVPNHGDITTIDWATVEPVDILTGGFPCQDVSLAGARAGLKDGTRSGLWSYFAAAIDALNPSLVVIENVRGLLSATAGGPMESDPWGVGDGAARPVVNALGAVLGDLADLGYDAEWCGVRAADAGAPHGRFRVFILAYPSVQHSGHSSGGSEFGVEREPGDGVRKSGDFASQNADHAASGERREPAPGEAESGRARADAGRRSGAPTTNAGGDGFSGHTELDRTAEEPGLEALQREHADGRSSTLPAIGDTDLTGLEGWRVSAERADERSTRSDDLGTGTDWGLYEPAIGRWEAVLGRVAPAPTNPDGRDGSHRLSARFVEWMMGLPEGHVTDPAIALTRNQQLKALGNGVVPQQATLALEYLLTRESVAA